MPRYDVYEVFRKAPDTSVRLALEEMAKVDPLIFAMVYRRLRGRTLIFDESKVIGSPDVADKEYHRENLTEAEREMKGMLTRHRPFLIQPLCDLHPHKSYQKGRQTGVTENSVTEVIQFLMGHENTKWIYTFPRDRQLVDFSTTRLNEALNESPRMKRLFGIPNQVYTKRIGTNSFLFMRSAWESNLGEGVDADGVTFDEKDRMQDQIEVAFEESLSASKWHLRRDVSTPSLPGRGVNATFEKSCQFEWHVKCLKCGMEQTIEYPDNIIQMADIPVGTSELPRGAYAYRCRKERCRGHLDRLHGRWIPKYPERSLIHGYWIPQQICPWISATEIMQKLIKYRFRQLWENYVLGRTSVGENVMLSDEDFASIIANHEMVHSRTPDWDRITIGIDWGHLNWVLVLGQNSHNGKKYVLNIGIFEDSATDPFQAARDVTNFIAPYEPDVIVPDAGYGKDRNSYLLKKFPKRVFACLDENTKVATLDHQGWKYIKDVKVGDYTYAWDGTRCVPTKITHVHNNGVKKTLKVVVRDGTGREKTIIATPDHVFPLRLGGKKRADELQPGDRLVPFGRWKTKKGKYRAVDVFAMQKRGRVLIYEHRLVKSGCNVVHHKDHDGLNNMPDNLEGCATALEHRKAHPIHMPQSWVDSLVERNKRFANSKSRAKNFANHVVVRVEEGEARPVWDLTVEHDAHNFALEDGVFVKNCWYNPSEEKSRTFNPVWSEALSKVLVDRTMTLKNMCRALKDKEIGLPRMDQKTAMLIKHIKALAPMKEENEKGEIVEVIGHTGPDHLSHALGYSLVGFEKLEAGSAFSVDFIGG